MALRDRIKAKEEAEKAATQAAEERKALLLKRGLDRNLRNAYFHGLVVAAFANDDHELVDDSERSVLQDVGSQMNMSESMVADAINRVSYLNDDAKMELIRETVGCLDRVETAEFFISEFTHIWTLGGGSEQGRVGFLSDFDKWLPIDVGEAILKKRKEADDKRKIQEKKLVESQRKADEFYKTVNTFFLDGDIQIGQLQEAKSYLCKNGYDDLPQGKIWASIYRNYDEEIRGVVQCDVPNDALNSDAVRSAFATVVGAVLPGFGAVGGILGLASHFNAWAISNSDCDSPIKQRYIRRRGIWALACLYALNHEVDDSSLCLFNQMLKLSESVACYKTQDVGVSRYMGGDSFWKKEIEPALCRWLDVPPV